MSLVNEIKTICTTLYPNATVIFASKFKASRESFNISDFNMPLIVIDNELTKNIEVKKNFNLTKETRILLSVLNTDDIFVTDEDKNDNVECCELIANRIMNNIFQSDLVQVVNNPKYKVTPAFNAYVTGLSGVIIDALVNEIEVINICQI